MLHKLMGKHVMWDIGDGTRARTRSPELPLPVSAPEAGTARPANAPKPALGLLLALYNANVTTDWVAVAKAAARIPIRAIIPVPGVTPPDPDWAPMYPSPSAYRRGVAMLRSAGVEVFAYTHLRNLSRPCCTCCGNLTQLDTWLDRIEGSADFDGVMLDNMDAAWSSAQPYHPDGLHEMYLPAAAMVRRRGLGVWANGPHVAHNGSAERPAPAWRAYLELVTLTTIFEIPVDTWLAMPPHVNFSSALQWPSSRLGGYVLRLPDNATAAAPLITKSLEAAVGRGLSWLYPTVKCKRAPGATHGVCTYAELPSYWTELTDGKHLVIRVSAMAVIEELDDDDDGCLLEDNPGECALEDNPDDDGGCLLEENPDAEATGNDGSPVLEINPEDTDEDEDEDEDVWEIPYAPEEKVAVPTTQKLDVRLHREGGERLGLVLDASNVIVALREDTPAARSGEIFVGDEVLAVQGVACSTERRVAQLLRELPDAAVYVLTVERALDATRSALSEEVVDHGPLLTPEEQRQQQQRELEKRHELRQEVDALPADHANKAALQQSLAPQNLTESKYASANSKLSAAAEKSMKDMWYRQARQDLARRLSAAEMLKDEGNDKYAEGEYEQALDEYGYALNLFDYEMANLMRDQEAAELGDYKRGLSSDDLPRMQAVRVPCLLNSAACHLKLKTKTHLTKALECCAQVLQAGPPAEKRSKAHFRIGQAHFALENYREAWVALTQAQELHPSSREVRALQAKVSYELKQLKVAERESREGLMTTELNHKQLFKQEKLSYATKLSMLRTLLPAAGSREEAKIVSESASRDTLEALLETVAAKGWTNLSGQQQMLFASVWSAAHPRLGAGSIRDGRDAGIFPPRDEERIFGHNLPQALMSKPFPERLGWLGAAQKQRARGLALTIWQRGVEDLDHAERRLCEGLELLAMGTHSAPWHQKPLGRGGAQLVLSQARMHKWAFIPPTLRVQKAVMGSAKSGSELAAINRGARRPMAPGEIGIVLSNLECWQHALDAGWEWTLVLEDDCKVALDGGALQLLALLPELIAAAAAQDEQWELLCLSPHGMEPFYELCDPRHIPGLFGDAMPPWARRPKVLGDSGWKRIGPTFHAFGWVYRAPLMRKLVRSYQEQSPPLNPLDVWVWEVMAKHEMLGCALAPTTWLVGTSDTPGGGGSLNPHAAVRQAQQGRVV